MVNIPGGDWCWTATHRVCCPNPKDQERMRSSGQWCNLETRLVLRLSQDIAFHGSISTFVLSCLGSVSSYNVSSCLMSHDCVLTMSLSGIAKCLFCAETLAFLAEGPFTLCLLT